MSVILPNGRNFFTDLNGDPLVGGRLFTYAPGPGVTTPKTTYFDNANTAAHTNPIILDARGEATIFWNGGYNVRLEDSLGGLIWSVESINTDPSAASLDALLRADLLDHTLPTKGGGIVGFNPTLNYAAGSIGDSLASREWLVTDFPWLAKFDGVTDDTAAIIACATALYNAGGGTMIFPRGTAMVTSVAITFTMDQRGISIRGQGKRATKLQKIGATTTPVLDLKTTGALYDIGSELRDFSIIGNAKGSPGLRTNLIAKFSLFNIGIDGCSDGWRNEGSLIATVYGLDLRSNNNGYVSQRATATGGGLVYPNLIEFDGGQVIGNSVLGFDLIYGSGVSLVNVDIEFNGVSGDVTTGGVRIRSTFTAEISFGNFISNNSWFESNLGPSLTVENCPGLLLSLQDTKFIRNSVSESAVAMSIGTIEASALLNCLAVSSLSGGLTTTIAASRSVVQGGLYTTLTDNSTGYTHSEVGTSTSFQHLSVGGSGGGLSEIQPSFGNFGGSRIGRLFSIADPVNSFVITDIPVDTGSSVYGVMVLLRGRELSSGISFTRLFLVSIRAPGGSGTDVVAVQIGTSGPAGPTFTFSNSSGLLAVSNTAGSGAVVTIIGG